MFNRRSILSAAIAGTLFASVPTLAANNSANQPLKKSDGTWVTLSGEVTKVSADVFTMDYGDGEVLVEVDDGDFDNDAYKFLDGDKVTVTGKVDKNFFTSNTLEAQSIYVEGLNTTFISSAADEEEADRYITVAYMPADLTEMTLVGDVTAVKENSFEIKVAGQNITVSTDDLGFDPMDDEGYLKIADGDRIKVVANVEPEFFGDYALEAETIIKMNNTPS